VAHAALAGGGPVRSAGSVTVVYDDSAPVPLDVSSMTGVTRFGDMLRRRERLSASMRALASESGMAGMLHLRDPGDLPSVAEGIRGHPHDALYMLMPSRLAPTVDRNEAALFLRKLRHLTQPVALWQHDRLSGACLVDRDGLLAYLSADAAGEERGRRLEDYAERLSPVEDALGLADLSELATALEFLSGSFSARHFNQVSQDRYYVVKRSRDRTKIRREYRFFGFLPEAMQPFFVQPFDFQEDAEGASYRMRRLFVPDLAVQWVHRAFTETQFSQLLSHLLHFVEDRPRRRVGREGARAIAASLYVDKVETRIATLLELPAGREVDATLRAGGVEDGVRGIQRDFVAAYERLARRRRDDELSVSHGDLGFSNILYSPSTQSFQLIDPRGADEAEEVYSDPYYDVAKLSHSVVGGYDFIVAGLYELEHTEDLALALKLDHPVSDEVRSQFESALALHGFDPEVVRLCEASLFLSMLPLHIDAPKRVTAFALRARDILAELDGAR